MTMDLTEFVLYALHTDKGINEQAVRTIVDGAAGDLRNAVGDAVQ
jgi:hypothetical protein